MASPSVQEADEHQQTLEAFLKCRLCRDLYKDPLLLPCLHSACTCCLVRLQKAAPTPTAELQCPECEEKFKLPDGKVENLKPNLFIRGLLELWAARQGRGFLCTACQLVRGPQSRVAARSRCLDCGDFLCEACAPGHRLSSATWTHNVADLSEIQRGRFDDKLRFLRRVGCSRHEGRLLEYFCCKCEQGVCSVCVLVEHRGHKISSALEAVRTRTPAINRALTEVKDKIRVLGKNKQMAIDYIKMIEDGQDTMLSLIHSKASAMVDLVKTEAVRAYQKVDEIYKGHWTLAEKERERLKLQQALALSCVELSERVLSEGTDMELLCLESVLMDRLKNMNRLSVSEEVDISRVPNFSIDLLLPLRVVPNEGAASETHVDMARISLNLYFKFDVTFLCDTKDPFIRSISFSRNGLYLADRANCKLKLMTLQGRPLTSVAFVDFQPELLAFTKEVVACLSDHRLHFFNAELKLKRIVYLDKPIVSHNFLYPFALTRFSSENFLVCNLEEKLFLVYHHTGELVRSFYLHMEHTIVSAVTDVSGNIVVGDWRSHCVWMYSQRGDMIRRCQKKGFGRSNTTWRPRGVVVQDNNYVYVADTESVVIFDEMGEKLDVHNTEKDGVRRPRALALGEGHRTLYVVGQGGMVGVYTINIARSDALKK